MIKTSRHTHRKTLFARLACGWVRAVWRAVHAKAHLSIVQVAQTFARSDPKICAGCTIDMSQMLQICKQIVNSIDNQYFL
jgi:hypothetical protein